MLSYFGQYEKSKNVKSDTPIDDVWQMLLRLSDINYLKKIWVNKNEEDYIYTSTALKQSHEYFIASKSLSMKTRPLLLYYCFLNLTKAILFMDTDKRPPDFHGLCKEDIEKSIEVSSDILSFSAETNNGVFLELAKAYGWDVSKKCKFTLDDFMRNNIELVSDSLNYFQIIPYFIYPTISGSSDMELKITIDERMLRTLNVSVEEICNKFKNKLNFKINSNNDTLMISYKISDDKLIFSKFNDKVCELIDGIVEYSVFNDGRYYINVAPEEKKIPNANTYFGIMFILSSIVRYKPEHIFKLVDDKDTSIEWFLNRICDEAERVYPNLMINLLYKQNYKFSAQSI